MSGYPPYYPVSHDRYGFLNPTNPYGLKSEGEAKPPSESRQYRPSPALQQLVEESQANLVLLATLEECVANLIESRAENTQANNNMLVEFFKQLK